MINKWEDREIKGIINFLKSRTRKNVVSSKKDSSLSAPRFVFICGKSMKSKEKTVRDITIEYFKKHQIKNEYGNKMESVLSIISELLYVQDLSEDIFSFEKMLAEISQRIIIVTESAGTFCELGAFVMDEECMKKTVVINEDKEEFKESFVTNGPIKMLENRDEKSVILYNGVIKNNVEYMLRMKEIADEDLVIPINSNSNSIALKSLIYELTNIVELFQPLTVFEIEMLYKEIKGFNTYTIKNTSNHKIKTIKKVVNLMEMMALIIKNTDTGEYSVRNNISCYNILFKLSRKEFMDERLKYLNRLYKYEELRVENL